jgi:hypothetical protein
MSVIGYGKTFAAIDKDGVLGRTVKRMRQGLRYAEDLEKFLLGSDWLLDPKGARHGAPLRK